MSTAQLFLTLTSLTDPGRHAEYNAWHQLDHLPENRLVPGVEWGDRWVRTDECAALSHVGDPSLANTQYAVAYGFREPVATAIDGWTALNQRALWWGRRPELGWTHRAPLGFFHPTRTSAAARVLIAPEALPHRPHCGVLLVVSRLADPGEPGSVRALRATEQERIPALLETPGVAGISSFRHAGNGAGFGQASAAPDPGLMVRIIYFDADPAATTRAVEERDSSWLGRSTGPDDQEHVLLSTPMLSITPWEWDWFADSARER